ncbi:protein trichome birefringence-like 19 isoform X2 [Ananas comosus]|uniref:Protein trichome birefringence-like 19 isoform X2 n=1 Tax=Ananas comosus TaxID=4615 RepID=A0A6P5F353_ANACO|nr:protein trichome birefringence-like 19 isoform X2 [Ananas comosus]
MKSPLLKLPFSRHRHSPQSFPKFVLLVVLILVFFTKITLYDALVASSAGAADEDAAAYFVNLTECDIFRGKWKWDSEMPYYTNKNCFTIQEHQNCLKYGRPDLSFLKWRWKPESCELPRFDAARFLNLVRHKSLAFVGDSLARNHMQSLLCVLSKVEHPKDISDSRDPNFKRMIFRSYGFTILIFWSPFLIKAHEIDSNGPTHTGLWNLYLDEADDNWASQISRFDYIIMSASNWFTRSSMFYEKGRLVGCHYCLDDNVTDLTLRYSHRMAFRTALRTINELNFKGKMILRTVSPSHFENGEWNKGGNCMRTWPFRSNDTRLEGLEAEFYNMQVEEFREAEKEARKKGVKLMLMDTTEAMLLRPDGHPSRYGHRANEKVTLYNDCVHWCLPGPIDVWNDMLLQMLRV